MNIWQDIFKRTKGVNYAFQFMLVLAGIFGTTQSIAQVQQYPAKITPFLGQPHSLFISDYSTPGTNTLQANIVFNDFNEPVWDFRLKLKIESSSVKLETRTEYLPMSPISLAPGVVQTLSGADWAGYLNYDNLNIGGISLNQLASSGRLPEGFYSFCLQVLDYDTGDPLSEEACTTVWLNLNDAPRLSLPLCDDAIDPKLQQIPFNWQQFDTQSPNAQQETQYQLTIWEVLEKGVNPQTAVANGQALQIFQSNELTEPSYLYGPADPPMELGKEYVYRVQAKDPGGRDRFKNQGYSQFCRLYYGWPIGGEIALKFPEEGGGFRKKDIPNVHWKTVDSKLPNQEVSYQVYVAPMDDGQTPEQAILSNNPWYNYTTPPANIDYDRSQQINKTLDVQTKYAWQIKAYTDQQEVGKSEVSYFNGPALMENFWAGNHRIAVDYVDGTNLDNISGGGRIRLKADPNAWTPITFKNIQLKDAGDFYVMTGGEFYHEPQNLTITLPAQLEENGDAYFDISRFKVDKEGLYAEGAVRWPFPFATLSTEVAEIRSETIWANYNNFTINTAANLKEGNDFDLVDPYEFALRFNESSLVYIYNNKFRLELDGLVDLPSAIDGIIDDRVNFSFRDIEQLYYIEQEGVNGYTHISPMQSANFEVITNKYTLDLSEEVSPEKFADNALWKGIFMDNFDLKFNKSLDTKGQFELTNELTKNFAQSTTDELDAWVTTAGLNLKVDTDFEQDDNMIFQTFPSGMKRFKFEMDQSQVVSEQSLIEGDFVLPVVSEEDRFDFTIPIDNLGFQDGFLENLTGIEFVHNPGSGDQEINVKIKRAVLTGYEKISMTIDLEWPSMGVLLSDLRGFRAWGDYGIGFDSKNGTVPLTQRYNASLSGYPVTIGVIGAASNDGSYVFATTADAGLGDDVAGGEGAPTVNVYSIDENPFVPTGSSGAIVESETDQISFEEASGGVAQDFEELEAGLIADVQEAQAQAIAEAEALQASLSSSAQAYGIEEIVQSDEVTNPGEYGYGDQSLEGDEYNSRQQEVVYEIAAGFIEELARPILDPIKNKTDSLNLTIENAVNGIVEDVSIKVHDNVEKIVNNVANKLANSLQNNKVDVHGPINDMAKATTDAITEEITSSLKQATKNNILEPIKVLLKDKVEGRIVNHITTKGTEAVYAMLVNGGDGTDDALKELIADLPGVLNDAVKDVASFVSPENLKSTIESTGEDFIKNIDVGAVGHDLRRAAEEILKNAVNDELNKAVAGLAEKYADDLGLGGFGVGGENPIDFVGVAGRLAEGDIKGIFAVDPVRVKLRTPVIDLDGFMSYTPEHEVYGDVWVGDIDMTIKVPKKFAFNAIYFNGRKDDISYWFCQITPPRGDSDPYELGKPLAKEAKALERPVDIGIAKIVGASGRLYHHMSETANSGIMPDASMKYGAYMHFVFFDRNKNGKNLRLEVSGEINSSTNGDYTVAFDGNMQTRSKDPQVLEIDESAVIQGTVEIRYNSAEEHFFGYAKVVVNKPNKLCAEGSLLVDVKPGKWRIAIGSREERIIFVPGCSGWSPTGWLDINESEAEIGLGVQYSIKAESPSFWLVVAKVKFGVDAGVAFGVAATIRYNPDFKLVKAGVWLDMWAIIYAKYKFPFKSWKQKTLVDILIKGDLYVVFDPPPTLLEGNVRGRVQILGFKSNFNAEMSKEI